MIKSGRVRFQDIRRAYRLIHDCRDVGHDPAAWLAILVNGMARLVDAQVSICGHVGLDQDGRPCRGTVLAEQGWPSEEDRRFFHEKYENYYRVPMFQRFMSLPGARKTRSREQLAGDDEWYRSTEFNDFVRVLGLDDFLATGSPGDQPPSLSTYVMARSLGNARYTSRERRLIRLFHHELAGHLGTSLAYEPGGPFLQLGPRLRQTLHYLMDGDSEKHVALRLGLSRNTVHDYVGDLYRRLGVSSRGELMALCLRHRFQPASEPPRHPPSPGD